jgi:hypothetical protein
MTRAGGAARGRRNGEVTGDARATAEDGGLDPRQAALAGAGHAAGCGQATTSGAGI